jgi:hypothetical protein
VRRTKTLKTLAVALAVLLGVGTLVVVGCLVRSVLPAKSAFDRRRFEAVVAEVRRRPIPAGEQVALRLADPTVPGSARLIEAEAALARGGGAGRVWAERTKDGHLKVVIETQDAGHAGEYGFAFSEVPLKRVPLDANWSTVDVPGRLTIVGADAQIDEHWWAVLDNLD